MIRSTALPLAAYAFSPAFSKSRKAFLICLWSSFNKTMASVDISLLAADTGAGTTGRPRTRRRTPHAPVEPGYRALARTPPSRRASHAHRLLPLHRGVQPRRAARAGRRGRARRLRGVVDQRPLPPVERRAGQQPVRVER